MTQGPFTDTWQRWYGPRNFTRLHGYIFNRVYGIEHALSKIITHADIRIKKLVWSRVFFCLFFPPVWGP